jgi:hypothetical protein
MSDEYTTVYISAGQYNNFNEMLVHQKPGCIFGVNANTQNLHNTKRTGNQNNSCPQVLSVSVCQLAEVF